VFTGRRAAENRSAKKQQGGQGKRILDQIVQGRLQSMTPVFLA
jgi:hypothetical protein